MLVLRALKKDGKAKAYAMDAAVKSSSSIGETRVSDSHRETQRVTHIVYRPVLQPVLKLCVAIACAEFCLAS